MTGFVDSFSRNLRKTEEVGVAEETVQCSFFYLFFAWGIFKDGVNLATFRR
jgi:hypothetical protein